MERDGLGDFSAMRLIEKVTEKYYEHRVDREFKSSD
jgi:hypothetical protein